MSWYVILLGRLFFILFGFERVLPVFLDRRSTGDCQVVRGLYLVVEDYELALFVCVGQNIYIQEFQQSSNEVDLVDFFRLTGLQALSMLVNPLVQAPL